MHLSSCKTNVSPRSLFSSLLLFPHCFLTRPWYNYTVMQYIHSDLNILGGTPVVTGTRVPIGRILFLLKDGYTLEAIHEDYPHIAIPTLSKAVDEAIEAINT